MLIGIIADIHGNIRALKAVIGEMPEIDILLVAGDIAGRVKRLKEVFEIIDRYDAIMVRGNHEEMATRYFERFGGDDNRLKELVSRLNDAPYKKELHLGGVNILMAHGSPWEPKSEYIYPEYTDFSRFEGLGFDYIILGHTHVPMIIKTGDVTIINPGSVGEPQATDPRPSFATLDTEKRVAKIHYVKNYVEERRLRVITPFRWGMMQGWMERLSKDVNR